MCVVTPYVVGKNWNMFRRLKVKVTDIVGRTQVASVRWQWFRTLSSSVSGLSHREHMLAFVNERVSASLIVMDTLVRMIPKSSRSSATSLARKVSYHVLTAIDDLRFEYFTRMIDYEVRKT